MTYFESSSTSPASTLQTILNETIGNTSDQYEPYSKRLETYLIPFCFGLIMIIGIIGNFTLIIIFAKHRSMRTLPNTFIISLAIGDLLVMIGSVPFISVIYIIDSWPFGETMCKISEFLRDLSTGVSILTLTMLSIDRFLAVNSPLRVVKETPNKRTIFVMLTLTWSMSIVIALPGYLFSYLMTIEINPHRVIYICYPFPQRLGIIYPRSVLTLKFLLLYTLPLILIGTFHVLIARSLLKKSRDLTLNDLQMKRREKRVKVAKMILCLVVIFAICFLPNHVFLLWFYYTYPQSIDRYNIYWHILKILGYFLCSANSCLNPIILYCISKRFRNHLKNLLIGGNCKNQQLQRRPSFYLPSSDIRFRFLSGKKTQSQSTDLVKF